MTTIGEFQSDQTQTKECLLRQGNSVSNSKLSSFELRGLAWEASTLPLSYTRFFDWVYYAKAFQAVSRYRRLTCDILF